MTHWLSQHTCASRARLQSGGTLRACPHMPSGEAPGTRHSLRQQSALSLPTYPCKPAELWELYHCSSAAGPFNLQLALRDMPHEGPHGSAVRRDASDESTPLPSLVPSSSSETSTQVVCSMLPEGVAPAFQLYASRFSFRPPGSPSAGLASSH